MARARLVEAGSSGQLERHGSGLTNREGAEGVELGHGWEGGHPALASVESGVGGYRCSSGRCRRRREPSRYLRWWYRKCSEGSRNAAGKLSTLATIRHWSKAFTLSSRICEGWLRVSRLACRSLLSSGVCQRPSGDVTHVWMPGLPCFEALQVCQLKTFVSSRAVPSSHSGISTIAWGRGCKPASGTQSGYGATLVDFLQRLRRKKALEAPQF